MFKEAEIVLELLNRREALDSEIVEIEKEITKGYGDPLFDLSRFMNKKARLVDELQLIEQTIQRLK
ncbi:hypothetical protein [Bacillus infantis]|uniref:hypothetical protein n=1 Tax=Bacillus infantis TaxID=324767 RepID=UPI003CF98B90